MKYMKQRQYYNFSLQLFAEGEDNADGENTGGDDQNDEESDKDGEEEKVYSKKDMEAAVERRLARERRKWSQQQKEKKESAGEGKTGKDEDTEDSKARKAAEARADSLEIKVACYEAGVAKDAVDDVTAIARAYMEADESLDLEDAIEKVVKKYPAFKKGASDPYENEEKTSGSWGERQKGKGTRKMSGVESKFYELNPDLK